MNKVLLVILDGWGHGANSAASAIAQANTPFIDSLYQQYPNSELVTYGEAVGLPSGQMGNSEVGHLNIGAGRVVYQELLRINNAVKDGSLASNAVLKNALMHAEQHKVNVHFMGLVSDGGVHSHINHLKALCDIAEGYGTNYFVHAFTDGRDVDPKSGKGHIAAIEQHLENKRGEVTSVIGRYYAMDRDQRWKRIKLAYDLLLEGKGNPADNIQEAIQQSYEDGVTDEFLKPIVKVDEAGNPVAVIKPNDVVICFNFRTDRCRQITQVLTQQDLPNHEMSTLPLHYVTMTNYDDDFKGINVVFEKDNLSNTLGEVLSKAGATQLRAAETEKYPHVTFFFNGGREAAFDGEERILEPSPKVATYDLQPEMSAIPLTNKVLEAIKANNYNFVCINYANPDMVGHTGVFKAAIKACKTVDSCAKSLINTAIEQDYQILVIADHGNCDFMINNDGSPHTAHTTNPVPCILVNSSYSEIKDGKLGDLASTILHLMGIEAPKEMTGKSLLN